MAHQFVRNNVSDRQYREILNFEMPLVELEAWTIYTLGGVRPDGKAANEYYEWVKDPELPFEEEAILTSA